MLRVVDAVLDSPYPQPRPARYVELAEEAIGQLDPIRQGVAEHEAIETLIAAVRIGHGPEAIRIGFRNAMRVYRDTLAGRRIVSGDHETLARDQHVHRLLNAPAMGCPGAGQ